MEFKDTNQENYTKIKEDTNLQAERTCCMSEKIDPKFSTRSHCRIISLSK